MNYYDGVSQAFFGGGPLSDGPLAIAIQSLLVPLRQVLAQPIQMTKKRFLLLFGENAHNGFVLNGTTLLHFSHPLLAGRG